MSFRCEVCNRAQQPGTRPIKVVTGVRERKYYHKGEPAIGWETVHEKAVCVPCSKKVEDVSDRYLAQKMANVGKLGAV